MPRNDQGWRSPWALLADGGQIGTGTHLGAVLTGSMLYHLGKRPNPHAPLSCFLRPSPFSSKGPYFNPVMKWVLRIAGTSTAFVFGCALLGYQYKEIPTFYYFFNPDRVVYEIGTKRRGTVRDGEAAEHWIQTGAIAALLISVPHLHSAKGFHGLRMELLTTVGRVSLGACMANFAHATKSRFLDQAFLLSSFRRLHSSL
ncbi:hypothetical protein EJ08DRAFT_469058 [Tothia fuscella]|uniref:Uncharacterized protein n=1 Tax=Tothia fuscella TaxID=1048955 RepID=A0A9P4P0K9_9PEZI|nr:hypothetical protein EJ08DRAFT_469058 [Tothia fuscella]